MNNIQRGGERALVEAMASEIHTLDFRPTTVSVGESIDVGERVEGLIEERTCKEEERKHRVLNVPWKSVFISEEFRQAVAHHQEVDRDVPVNSTYSTIQCNTSNWSQVSLRLHLA